MFDRKDAISGETVKTIVEAYKPLAGNPSKVTIFTPEQVESIVEVAARKELDKAFLEASYADIKQYGQIQAKK